MELARQRHRIVVVGHGHAAIVQQQAFFAFLPPFFVLGIGRHGLHLAAGDSCQTNGLRPHLPVVEQQVQVLGHRRQHVGHFSCHIPRLPRDERHPPGIQAEQRHPVARDLQERIFMDGLDVLLTGIQTHVLDVEHHLLLQVVEVTTESVDGLLSGGEKHLGGVVDEDVEQVYGSLLHAVREKAEPQDVPADGHHTGAHTVCLHRRRLPSENTVEPVGILAHRHQVVGLVVEDNDAAGFAAVFGQSLGHEDGQVAVEELAEPLLTHSPDFTDEQGTLLRSQPPERPLVQAEEVGAHGIPHRVVVVAEGEVGLGHGLQPFLQVLLRLDRHERVVEALRGEVAQQPGLVEIIDVQQGIALLHILEQGIVYFHGFVFLLFGWWMGMGKIREREFRKT